MKKNHKEIQEPFEIGGVVVQPGIIKTIHIPVATLTNHTPFDLNLRVIHGHRPGKRLFISSTVHGDELNGIEVIRRILASPLIKHIHGTLVTIPIVNFIGMITHSRYLPDRRDLNRSFPGSETGSAASQLASTFLNEIVKKCTHGIDLHTGSNHRINIPQLRCDFKSEEALKIAHAFGAPIILKAKLRDGSLREASEKMGIPTICFEGGEAFRFNEFAIRAAVQGIFRVMGALGMISPEKYSAAKAFPIISFGSRWVRAPLTGIFRTSCDLGKKVMKGDIIGKISDPLGINTANVVSCVEGVIIGRTQLPLVFKGDALFNIASVHNPAKAETAIEEFEEQAELNPSLDDPTTYY